MTRDQIKSLGLYLLGRSGKRASFPPQIDAGDSKFC